jgi:UDPglucose 6-dehydrogenase
MAKVKHTARIGFIGQGFIGKNYADDFEARDFDVVRYAMEEPHIQNKEDIASCDFVFIAVPTPTTDSGFDFSIVEDVLHLVGKGKIAIIKSTVLPGTTRYLQERFKDIIVLHSPEFLCESTAAYDAAHPNRNIIGVVNNEHRPSAERVLKIMAAAPFSLVCTAEEAELCKYARNVVGAMRVIFYNLLYDLSQKYDAEWSPIAEAVSADPDNGPTYTQPIHKSGRGAGGHCFIKDLVAFREIYEKTFKADLPGIAILKSLEDKNKKLLTESGKDLDLIRGVYGKNYDAS